MAGISGQLYDNMHRRFRTNRMSLYIIENSRTCWTSMGWYLLFLFCRRFHREFIQNSSYEVEFMFNRTTLKVMHRAIQNAAPYLHQIPFDGQPSPEHNVMQHGRLT